MNILSWTTASLLTAVLSGCTASSSAIVQSLQFAVQSDSTVARSQLNPDFRYLRVAIKGRIALLVLGYVENDPQGPIQVWYSAEREVLRLQNGRIVGAVGLTTEWRNVTLPNFPTWSSIVKIGKPSRLIRIRDVMPGYRYGVQDNLVLRVTIPPSRSALQILDPESLTWFEEPIEFVPGVARTTEEDPLPPARYAVSFQDGTETVIYGEQCLAADLCFAWQRWPVIPQGAKATR